MNIVLRPCISIRLLVAAIVAAGALVLPSIAAAEVDFGSLATDVTVSTPKSLLPANGEMLAYPSDPMEFSWDNVPGSANYEFQLAEENSGSVNCSLIGAFSAQLIRVDTTVTRPGYVPTMVDTQSAKIWTGTYCWRVRGIAPDGTYGLWASGNRVSRTWSGTPTGLKFYNDEDGSTPRLPSDSDYATGSTITKVGGYLQWTAVSGAAGYDVQIASVQSFSPTSIVLSTDNRKGTRIVLPHLPNDIYYWRVRSVSPNGTESPWAGGSSQTFEIRWYDATWRDQANVTPTQGTTQGEVTMGWTPMRGAAYYEVQAATRAGCFWEDNTGTGFLPRPWGDWVNDPSYTPPATLAVPEPPVYPSPPRSDECRLTLPKVTTINNYITLDKVFAPEVFANIGNDACWQAETVNCFDAGLPAVGFYGWNGPYNKYPAGSWTLDSLMNTIYGPGGPRIHWRVRPVYQISQATEGGWTVSGTSEVYGRWLEYDAGSSSQPLNFYLDPNADLPVSTGTHCASFDNPTAGNNGCLVMDANLADTDRPTRMQAGASNVDDSTSMQFPVMQWQQFAGNIFPNYAGGYIVQIARDADFATIKTGGREVYVPFLNAQGWGWQNSIALTDSLPDNAEGTGYWWRAVPCESSPPLIPSDVASPCTPLYYAATAGTHFDYNDGTDAQTFTKRTSIVTEKSDAFAGQAPLISWHPSTASTPAEKSRGIEGADHYEIQFASDPFFNNNARTYFTTVARFTPYLPSASAGVNGDLEDGLWYYRVRAVDRDGLEGAWSDTGNFSKRIPAPVLASSPVQQTSTGATFEWLPVADADYYEVQYSTDSSFQNGTVINQQSTQQTSFLAPVTSGTVYWRVRAVVGTNQGLFSAVDDSGPVVTVNPPLTIQFEVSRQNIPPGQTVYFDGYLSGDGMVNLNGKTIELRRKDTACGEAGTYTTIASQDTGSTGSEGTVRIGATADRNRCYRLAWNRGDRLFYSAPMSVTVSPKLKLTSARVRVRRAANFNMTVSGATALTGRVRVQYRVKNAWVNIKTMTFSNRKSYKFAAQVNKAGSFQTRVVADRLHTAAGYKAYEDTTGKGPSVRVLDLFRLYGRK